MGSIGRVVADRRETIPYLHIIDPLVNRVRSTAVKIRHHDAVDGRRPKPARKPKALLTMNKIMEYMALSKPIVQFDVREGRVSAQRASLYARPNDPIDFAEKILELLDNPERRMRMGKYGRERVEKTLAWHPKNRSY